MSLCPLIMIWPRHHVNLLYAHCVELCYDSSAIPDELRIIRRHTVAIDVDTCKQKTALVPINHAEYIRCCREMRESATPESIASSDSPVFSVELEL
ncbi:hypothetical protein F5X96DRAFT_661828 [Biscogniauxia mediterranea]|nr:hypothetical protein F5X96DRAFT_661828 [Biscogniauxia mediterranea]